MFFILFVLHDTDALNDVLTAWEECGVSGVTILPSTGLAPNCITANSADSQPPMTTACSSPPWPSSRISSGGKGMRMPSPVASRATVTRRKPSAPRRGAPSSANADDLGVAALQRKRHVGDAQVLDELDPVFAGRQTAWTQQLSLVFGASELAVISVLAAFMACTSVGPQLRGQWAPRPAFRHPGAASPTTGAPPHPHNSSSSLTHTSHHTNTQLT